jgi:3-oxocholest-4-en-26-oyl-CoA dehydrogenase beta subunit
VPAAHLAAEMVVPAGDATWLVPCDAVAMEPQAATSGEPRFRVQFDGAPAERLGGPEVERWLVERATVGLCALQAGLADRALRMTAEYTASRQQFERPIATFQAVSQRVADAYIDAEAIRLTMLQAAWRLDEGMPASDEVAIAKFWASDGGQRVLAAAQHLHGGMGADTDYPLHRYTLWSKQIELTLGSGTRQLVALGEAMAR